MNRICYWCMHTLAANTNADTADLSENVSTMLIDTAMYSSQLYHISDHTVNIMPDQAVLHPKCNRQHAIMARKNALLNRRLSQFMRLPFMQFLDYQQTLRDIRTGITAVREWLVDDIGTTLVKRVSGNRHEYIVGNSLTAPADLFVMMRAVKFAFDAVGALASVFDSYLDRINCDIQWSLNFTDELGGNLSEFLKNSGLPTDISAARKCRDDSTQLTESYARRMTAAINVRLSFTFYTTLAARYSELHGRLLLPDYIISGTTPPIALTGKTDITLLSPYRLQEELVDTISQTADILPNAAEVFNKVNSLDGGINRASATIAFCDKLAETKSSLKRTTIENYIAPILDPIPTIESEANAIVTKARRAFAQRARHSTIDYLLHLLCLPSLPKQPTSQSSSTSSPSSLPSTPGRSFKHSPSKKTTSVPDDAQMVRLIAQLVQCNDHRGDETLDNISAILMSYDSSSH
jgi:hypothetical protein